MRGRAVGVARDGHALRCDGLPRPRYVWPTITDLRGLQEGQLKYENGRHHAREKRTNVGVASLAHHNCHDNLALHQVNRLM